MQVTSRKSTGGRGAQLCRACLRARPAREAVSLWALWQPPWGEAQSAVCVARELAAVAGTSIKPDDHFPSYICMACFESFTEMYSFLYNVRQSDQIMRLNKHIFLEKEEPEAVFGRAVSVGRSRSTSVDDSSDEVFLDDDIKEEEVSEDEVIEHPELPIKLDEIKIEPEEIVQSTERILNGHTPQRGLKSLVSNIVISNTYSLDTQESSPCSADNPLLVQRFSKAVNSTFEPTVVKTERVDLGQDDSDSDLPLDCMLCDKSLRTISGLKAHVTSCHSYKTVTKRSKLIKDKHAAVKAGNVLKIKDKKPVLKVESEQDNEPTCVVCRKKFLSLKSLRNHERVHNTGCIYCQAQFPSFLALASHMEVCQEKLGNTPKSILPGKPKTVQQLRRISMVNEGEVGAKRRKTTSEEKETFACTQCNEKFEESIYLKIHNEIHHNELDDDDEDILDDDKDAETDKESLVLLNKKTTTATNQNRDSTENYTTEEITTKVDEAIGDNQTNNETLPEERKNVKVNVTMINDKTSEINVEEKYNDKVNEKMLNNESDKDKMDSDTINVSEKSYVAGVEHNRKAMITSVQITDDDNELNSEFGDENKENNDLVHPTTCLKDSNIISAEVASVTIDKSTENDLPLPTNTGTTDEHHEGVQVIPMDLEPTVEENNVMVDTNMVTVKEIIRPNSFEAANNLISVSPVIGSNQARTEKGQDDTSVLVPIDDESNTGIKCSLKEVGPVEAGQDTNILNFLVPTELETKAVVADESGIADVRNVSVVLSEFPQEQEKNNHDQGLLEVCSQLLPNDAIITGMCSDAVDDYDSNVAIVDESSQDNGMGTNETEHSSAEAKNL